MKTIYSYCRALLVLGLVWLPFIVHASSTEDKQAASEPDRRLLSYAVSENLLPYTRLEADYARVIPGSDVFGNNLTLGITSGQRIKQAGISSEIAIDYPYKEGEIVHYSWRMIIPANFSADAKNRWWLVARWTAQPNLKMGEKPESFSTLNPAIMIGYKLVDGKDLFSLSYGVPDSISSEAFSVIRNEWTKLDLIVKWSSSKEGYAKLYVNDSKSPAKEVSGRNMYGKYHNLFRLGSFRNPAIPGEAFLAIGDVTIEKIK